MLDTPIVDVVPTELPSWSNHSYEILVPEAELLPSKVTIELAQSNVADAPGSTIGGDEFTVTVSIEEEVQPLSLSVTINVKSPATETSILFSVPTEFPF